MRGREGGRGPGQGRTGPWRGPCRRDPPVGARPRAAGPARHPGWGARGPKGFRPSPGGERGEDGPGRSEGAKGEGAQRARVQTHGISRNGARGPRCMVGAVAGGGPWAGPPDPSLSVAALAGRRRTPMPPGWVARQLALCHGPSRPCTLPASPRTEDPDHPGHPQGADVGGPPGTGNSTLVAHPHSRVAPRATARGPAVRAGRPGAQAVPESICRSDEGKGQNSPLGGRPQRELLHILPCQAGRLSVAGGAVGSRTRGTPASGTGAVAHRSGAYAPPA